MSSNSSRTYDEWIGRRQSSTDFISPVPVAHLSALLDHTRPVATVGEMLPPCWHWLYFLDSVPSAELGGDGHRVRGGFLPPVSLPRRMWAGSSLRFYSPLRVGEEVRRESRVTAVTSKQGHSGELVFVEVEHQIFRGEQLLLEEKQDIVYREPGQVNAKVQQPGIERDNQDRTGRWCQKITPDQTLLFRYSALTFNSHRIHYDRDYAVNEEGYPGLVVQGPLTATLLLNLLAREIPEAKLETFEFRGHRPLFAGSAIELFGEAVDGRVGLCAVNDSGELALSAEATLQR